MSAADGQSYWASDQFIRFSVKVSPKLRWHLLIQQITQQFRPRSPPRPLVASSTDVPFVDCSHSTRLLAATTLRNVLGTKNLAEILSERETISHVMQSSLDDATDPWGVKVERVEM